MTAIIERARATDIPALVELMDQFCSESRYTLDRGSAAVSFRSLLGDETRGAAWIARRNGESVGYVVLTLRHNMEFGAVSGVIDDLFVRPEFRRQGTASALLSELFDTCKERHVAAIHVEVSSSNAAASALYQLLGLRGYSDDRRTLSVQLSVEPHAV